MRAHRGHRGLVPAVAAVTLAGCGLVPSAGEPERFTGTWSGPQGQPAERGQSRDFTYEVMANVGPDHCDWQSAVFLSVGWPLGTTNGVTVGGAAESRQYVRDAEGLFDDPVLREGLDLDAELPPGSTATGYRRDATELWLGPDGGDRYVYLRTEDGVERWPRAVEPVACG